VEQQLDILLGKIDKVLEAQATTAEWQKGVQCDITEIKAQVKETNGTVKNHESRICVIEDWRKAVQPTVAESAKSVADMKVELAVLAVKYGSLGGGIALLITVLKLLGVF
jgi:hypothetical protein